jgi:ligand-binding sensor domain-containing protein
VGALGKALKHVRPVAARRTLVAFGMLLARGPCAFALDPALDVSQYAHKAWKVREGSTKRQITSIAQTPDGYLWLGTQFGMLRLDGVRTVPWQPPAVQDLPSSARSWSAEKLSGKDPEMTL